MASLDKVATEKTDEFPEDKASLQAMEKGAPYEQHTQLARELKNRHVAMISIGG
ncbi:hypothetical protein AAF712_004545 [Marasmius tenuissimus]|uniref:Uncharacterized protein n=1 Tax=Marasmius tenuissimus TaxID=585030 RepID=A0ABR3A4Y9_9AGAR